jgi:hypothetical protein
MMENLKSRRYQFGKSVKIILKWSWIWIGIISLRIWPFYSLLSVVIYFLLIVKSLCLTKQALHHQDILRSGCIDAHFIDLSSIWRWKVSFTPQPLSLPGKEPCYLLNRRLDGPQRWAGWCGEENSGSYWDLNSNWSVIQSVRIPTNIFL